MILELKRTNTGNTGTFGVMYAEGFACFTIEKPWRNNRPFESCISARTFKVIPFSSEKHPRCYKIVELNGGEVKGRWNILFHIANLAGDKKKGLQSDLSGCIAPGFSKGELRGQEAVLKSGVAMTALRRIIDAADSTTLVIEDLTTNAPELEKLMREG